MYADLVNMTRSNLGTEEDGIDLGSVSEGTVKRNATWSGISLDLRLIRRGGHNAIPTDTPVAVELMRALGLIEGP